jgi:flagellar biosynthesis protein FlhF
VFVDTAGTNPFDPNDLAMLAESIDAAGAEPLLVLAAGGDPMESVDIAAAYASLGVRRLFVSKLDLARRLGGLLAAVDAAAAAFSEASVSYQVADGLRPLNAVTLARLLLPHAAETPHTPLLQEALS